MTVARKVRIWPGCRVTVGPPAPCLEARGWLAARVVSCRDTMANSVKRAEVSRVSSSPPSRESRVCWRRRRSRPPVHRDRVRTWARDRQV